MIWLNPICLHWVQFMPIHRLLVLLSDPQHVCVPVFRLRGPLSCQYFPSTVPDESVLRRRIPQLWTASFTIIRRSTGGTRRSYGLRFSTRYQMHFPQVWRIRNHTEARLSVYPTVEHRKRKNVYFHLVLVYYSIDFVDRLDGLQSRHNLRPSRQTKIASSVITTSLHRNLQQYQQEDWPWRLVASLHPLFQHGLVDLQGFFARTY